MEIKEERRNKALAKYFESPEEQCGNVENVGKHTWKAVHTNVYIVIKLAYNYFS
jgi:hypothetical protein